MAGYLNTIKKNSRPYLATLADDIKARRDPTYFWPCGTQVYVGRQGSGKTISAVKHIRDLKIRYPNALLVSNIVLTGFNTVTFDTQKELQSELNSPQFTPLKDYVYFSTMPQLEIALTQINNGFHGVIYVVDEIHTYFNALESKNIPMFVFTEISQQRKQRKLIIGTSQLFLRMAKPLREQCDNLIVCNTIFGILTSQKAYDGMTLTQDYDGSMSGTIKKTGWFFHTREIRSSFDTYQKVVSGSEQYEEMIRMVEAPKKKGMFKKR